MLENPFSLSGRTALIAGASRGIGLAIARQTAAAGAHTILASRSIEALEQNAAALRAAGFSAEARSLDFTNPASIAALAGSLPDIDILVNVSGSVIRKPFQHVTEQEYHGLLQTNLHGIVSLTQKTGARMIARGKGGKIVFIGSLMSVAGLPYLTVYAITKSALAGLTRTLAAEWARYNIQVNCIAPGFIVTDLNRAVWQRKEMHDWLKGVQAAPNPGKPEDIAPLSVLLSGPGSDFITGQVIPVDGGYTTTAHWPLEV